MGKKQVSRAASMLLVSSLLFAVPSVRCEAAVITSNATDKIAVAFHAGTDYSAGDYVIYDAELYICTQETKGEWETVQADFMQITKYVASKCLSFIILAKHILNLQFSYSLLSSYLIFGN